jgi:glycosyltransferase involved in cell wall biosynthesis
VRLLIFGHWSHTGFGIVTEALASRFVAAGVDVRIIGVNHRGEPVRGPLAGRVWPDDNLRTHFKNHTARAIDGSLWPLLENDDEWKPDGVLAVADVSGLLNHIGSAFAAWQTVPVWHYCPIEGDNLPPLWRDIWATLRPVAMSDYGARVISEHIGRPVPRIYHGVDTDTFYPVSPARPLRWDGGTFRSREDCKRKFGLDPARKVLFRADRNVVRKNFDALISVFGRVAAVDPDVDLVLHCLPIDIEGIDIYQEVLRLPKEMQERVKFTQAHDTFRGLPAEGLCALYNAADVYISTTGGEGFGLTLAEAMACGVPVVATSWAAETEVVGPGGVLIPPLHDSYGEPVRYHSKFGMDWAVPDPRAFVEPTISLLSRPARRRSLGAEGRMHVQRSFSWDTAAAEFLRLFDASQEVAA